MNYILDERDRYLNKMKQDERRKNPKVRYKIKIEEKWLPIDYPVNGSIDEKMQYLKKRLPPRSAPKK